MKQTTHEEIILENHPNFLKIGNCHQCGADLKYLKRIHRIHFEWYCNVCYENKQKASEATLIKYGRIKGLRRAVDAINLEIQHVEEK